MKRILIADDEIYHAQSLEERLERKGYSIELAFDPTELLIKASSQTYDLIVADNNMGAGEKYTGIDIIERLRHTGLETPIFLHTKSLDQEMAMLARRAGANEVIPKANTRLLYDKIREYLKD